MMNVGIIQMKGLRGGERDGFLIEYFKNELENCLNYSGMYLQVDMEMIRR